MIFQRITLLLVKRSSQLPVDCCAFVDQCSLVKNLVFNAQMPFYSTLIHDAGTDSHALFKTIDRLLQRKPDKRLPYCSLSVELANRFATFFKVKIDNLRSELPDVDVPDYFAALHTPTLSCRLEYYSPTSIHELSQIDRFSGSWRSSWTNVLGTVYAVFTIFFNLWMPSTTMKLGKN